MNRPDLLAAIATDFVSMRRFWASSHKTGELPKGLPTLAQFGILSFLDSAEPHTLKELSHGLRITPSAATQLIEGLVRDKKIRRIPDGHDRRKIRLSLTDTGRSTLHRAKKHQVSRLTTVFSPLTLEELKQYHTLLQKLITHF
ncbi:MAG: MarR family winged helix-turn-helix transcriptional regulator [Patescibacteria group bacterium]